MCFRLGQASAKVLLGLEKGFEQGQALVLATTMFHTFITAVPIVVANRSGTDAHIVGGNMHLQRQDGNSNKRGTPRASTTDGKK